MQGTLSFVRSTGRTIALAVAAMLAFGGLLAMTSTPTAAVGVAPWFGPSVAVNVPPAYTAYQPSLAVGGDGTLYVAFGGWSGTTTRQDIFFAKSTDGGLTWTVPVRVNNDSGGAGQSEPSLFVDHNDAIHLVWTDGRAGNSDIFYARSTDGGLSFSANVRVNDNAANWQWEPDVAVDGQGLIHVVWTDNRIPFARGPDIYYANSTDDGLSFNVNQYINNDATDGEQGNPAIAAAPDRTVYVVWDDPRNPGRSRDVYFTKSTDLGATWVPNVLINDDATNSAQDFPAIAVDETGTVYIAWEDSRNSNTGPDIFATRSTNAGSSFAANVRVNQDMGIAAQLTPTLAANGGVVRAAWVDGRTMGATAYDVYAAASVDGLAWGEAIKVNDDALPAVDQFAPTIAVDGLGNAYAAWLDERLSGQDVFVGVLDVVAPLADAGGDRTEDQDVAISFDASSSLDNRGLVSYAWNLGDGTTVSGAVVSHSYRTPGTYPVTLTVTDYSGNAAADSITVTVRDTEAPIARGAGDRIVDEGQALFFDAGASTDNVGVASYLWDFGDNTTSPDAATTHVYAAPGTYTATLTVQDAAGNADTAQMTVTVRAVSPKAGELLGMIQNLWWVIALLALGMIVVGIVAASARRRRGRGGYEYRAAPMPSTEEPKSLEAAPEAGSDAPGPPPSD